MWAEFILAVLFIVLGLACGLSSIVVLWAGALQKAATGSTEPGTGNWAAFLAFLAFVLIGGGVLIFVS